MQIIWGKDLRARAVDQWTRELPITPKRGDIVDANGEILATSETSYAVFVRTRCVKDATRAADILSELLDVDRERLLEKLTKKATSEIIVKRRLDKKTVEKLEEYEIDGVYYSIDNSRVYPFKTMLSSTLGYIGSDGSGLVGIEGYYDKYLKGEKGEILYESDLIGNDINDTPSVVPAVAGMNLKLNIDSEIQQICESAIDKVNLAYTPKSADVIVMNPQNGKILAMANSLRYDLNEPPTNDIAILNKVTRNKLLVDSYEPGSTFKIVTALADIEEDMLGNKNALSMNHVFNSCDYRIVGGTRIKCWTKHVNGKHANETLSEALNNSCNPCFVDIALSLGKNTMYKYVQNLNFGNVTGVDFYGEAMGMLLPESSVTDGDLARISFGQTIAVTPIQLAAAACACINGGKYYAPQIADSVYDAKTGIEIKFEPKMKAQVSSENASKLLASYLERVVSEGSGKHAYIEGYRVGGKTGTAQKFENGKIKQGGYVMSFMGFFPANNPQYLALATVDEPIGGAYGSTVAAPVVKEIFESIIKCKGINVE